MIIESVKLDHFRNYDSLDLSFDRGTNLFYGDNAQGKTNILEAVYLCGTTKSHRGSQDRDMIQFGAQQAHIRMNILRDTVSYRIDMHLKKNRAKGIAINGVPIRKAGDLIALCSFIFFSPEDLNIIKNGPAHRRRLMDMQLCQLHAVYLSNLWKYNRVLMQRNALLKNFSYKPDDVQTLDIWDEQLIACGRELICARRSFCDKMNELAGPIHRKLSGGREELSVIYEQNVSGEDFPDRLRSGRDKDVRMKMTLCGPHRDDILFMAGDMDIRRFGSQGQQRTTALSMKLAQIDLVRYEKNEAPVLMLDDVLSELDAKRQYFLLDSIQTIQTLITCTGIDDFSGHHFRIDRSFQVVQGSVQEDIHDRKI